MPFKFTIITVCYNSARFIRTAIESVKAQVYPHIEYVVVDGASTDGTKDIIAQAAAEFGGRMRYLSERDHGIYDAMNKGLKMASGDIIGLLNADDVLESPNTVARYADCFGRTGADAVFADLFLVRPDNLDAIVRDWRSGPLPRHRMAWGWHPAHPTFYVKRSVYERFGTFDTRFRIGSDYELMLRFIQKHHINCAYLPERTVRMRIGGASNRSLANIAKANLESFRAWTANGLFPNPLTILGKVLRKVRQLI